MTLDLIAETIRNIEKFGIKIYEGGGEVWYDARRNLSDEENIRLGLYSRRVQENKIDFVEFLWKRDHGNGINRKASKDIIDGMVGLRGFRTL